MPDAKAFLTLLLEHGLTANLLRKEDIHLISGSYGEISRWEFSVLGTGRALARKTPRIAQAVAENVNAAPWKETER